MTYQDKEGGRTGDNGAPAGEGFGMGSFDGGHSASPLPAKAPSFSFRPDELEAFRGSGYELIPLHAPSALDARGRPIGKAPLKGWPNAEPLTVEEAGQRMAEGSNVGVRLRRCDLVVDIDPRNFEVGDDRSPVCRRTSASGSTTIHR